MVVRARLARSFVVKAALLLADLMDEIGSISDDLSTPWPTPAGRA